MSKEFIGGPGNPEPNIEEQKQLAKAEFIKLLQDPVYAIGSDAEAIISNPILDDEILKSDEVVEAAKEGFKKRMNLYHTTGEGAFLNKAVGIKDRVSLPQDFIDETINEAIDKEFGIGDIKSVINICQNFNRETKSLESRAKQLLLDILEDKLETSSETPLEDILRFYPRLDRDSEVKTAAKKFIDIQIPANDQETKAYYRTLLGVG